MVQLDNVLTERMPPICSVCIANYNGEAMLGDCLDSVFAQAGDVPLEVIVHDDASTDGSLAVLDRYPQVIVIASPTNVGFCVANNRMVTRAHGEYVLLLNNDAALYPDALSALLEAAKKQKGNCILTLPQYDWQTGTLVDRGCLLDLFYNPVPNLDPGRQQVAMVIGACLFVSRTLWIDLGAFPEWMESIAEDMYLSCCARLRDASVRVTSTSGYRHRQGVSFSGDRMTSNRLQTTFRRRRLSERNKTTVMLICTPTVLVWPLLALHLMMLLVEGAVLTLWRHNTRLWREIYAPTIGWLFAHISALYDCRKNVQAERRITLRAYSHVFVFFPQKLRLLHRHGLPTVR